MPLTPPPKDSYQSNLTSFGLNTAYMFNVLEQHLEDTQFKQYVYKIMHLTSILKTLNNPSFCIEKVYIAVTLTETNNLLNLKNDIRNQKECPADFKRKVVLESSTVHLVGSRHSSTKL